MPQIKIDISKATAQLFKGFESLSEAQIKQSVMRSINSALGKTQTQILRGIIQHYNVSRATIGAQVEIFKAHPAKFDEGNINYYNKQYSLSDFNPREVNNGIATGRFGRDKTYLSKRVKGLRANKILVTQGLVVQIIKGTDKVIQSAYLAFKEDRQNARAKAKGQYDRGFNFDTDKGAKTLRTVSVRSMIQQKEIEERFTETARQEYSTLLYRELQKRVKNIA